MIATYELPSPSAHGTEWVHLERMASARGMTLQAAIILLIEKQGARVRECYSQEFGKRWFVRVEHDAPLTLAGAQLKLAGE